MRGFQQDDMGLFTFYRQQAELEEKSHALKQEKLLKKRLQQSQLQKIKQLRYLQYKQRNSSSTPPPQNYQIPVYDFTQKAKQYIKQLEESGHRIVYEKKKRQKRYSNLEQGIHSKEQIQQFHIEPQERQVVKQIQSQEIFAKKKDYSKMNYYMLLDKQPVVPKQFNSIQIFEKGNEQNKKQTNVQSKKRSSTKVPLQSLKKLPKITSDVQPFSVKSSSSLPHREKKHKQMYYNPIDIILNNQKFNIKLGHKKKMAKIQKFDELNANANAEVMDKNSSVQQIIKKYRLIK